MTVNELIEKLNAMQVAGDMELCVKVSGGIGGSGRPIRDVSVGFDWDHGKVLLHPQDALTFRPKAASVK